MLVSRRFLFVSLGIFFTISPVGAGKFRTWFNGWMGNATSIPATDMNTAWVDDSFSDSDDEDSACSKSSATFDSESDLPVCDPLAAYSKPVVETWEAASKKGATSRRRYVSRKSGDDEITDACAEIKRIALLRWNADVACDSDFTDKAYVIYWSKVRWHISCCVNLLQELSCKTLRHAELYCVADERMVGRGNERVNIPAELVSFEDAYAKACALFNEYAMHASLLGFGVISTDKSKREPGLPDFVFGMCKSCGTSNKNVQSTSCERCDKCMIHIPSEISDMTMFGYDMCVLAFKLRLLKRALKALKIQMSNASYL